VKLMATVGELRKKLGDPVAKDEVIAILESREVADAKSEYLATKLASELNQDLHERDKVLWEKRIAPEQQYLRSRNLATSRMRFDIAAEAAGLGLLEKEIAGLPDEPEALLRRQEVRSPMAGRGRARGRSRNGGGARQPGDRAVRDRRSRPRVDRRQPRRPATGPGRPGRGDHGPRSQGQG
jgi:cobalt-zinc-cadmium efflux system membrane fusion protein